MSEPGITTYSIEAQRLFERGVKAARAKQRRVAAGFLTKAVQLDPRHEQAWLWLSGVLDDPKEMAFCLNAVLKINPDNAQAQKGLAWLRHKHAEAAQQPETSSQRLQAIHVPAHGEPEPEPVVEAEPQTWWQEWRTSERNQRRLRIGVMLAMVILVGITSLFLRSAMAQAITEPTSDLAKIPTAQPQAAVAQQTLMTAPEVNNAEMLQYLSDVGNVRQQLADATQQYREVSDVSTVATEQIAAANQYRGVLENGYTQLEQLKPPASLKEFHAEYLLGVQTEQAALDDVLEYYTNYNIAIANRAALRLQEAGGHYQRAVAGFNTYQQKLSQPINGIGFGER